MSIEASPAKLREGGWGAWAKSEERPSVGDRLTVHARSGAAWDAYVVRVITGKNGVWLCETSRDPVAPEDGGTPPNEYPVTQCPKCGHKHVGKPIEREPAPNSPADVGGYSDRGGYSGASSSPEPYDPGDYAPPGPDDDDLPF